MISIRLKIERSNKTQTWNDLPRYGRRLLLLTAVVSILIHIVSFLSAGGFRLRSEQAMTQSEPVKIRIADPSQFQSKEQSDLSKKILETPQKETAAPKKSEHLGPQNHIAQKETKLARKFLSDSKAQDAGQKGKQDAKDQTRSEATPRQMISGPGTLAIPSTTAPRTNYEKLLPNRESDVFGSPTAGYAEYIDADIPEGDRIDMNTTSFKFISYFTGMRKQIELVWIYPREAIERGLQGEVLLQLVIEKNGDVSKVKVVRSSGFPILDENMVKTIKQASPFAPLPKGWNKNRILVTGAFHYILSYGAH